MPRTTPAPAAVRRLLGAQRFAVLATCAGDRPHASLVAIWADPASGEILFVTPRNTLKYRNLAANRRAALLLDSRPARSGGARAGAALTVSGRVRELRGREAVQRLGAFLRRHPGMKAFASAPGCAIFALRPSGGTLATGLGAVRRLPRTP
ncbi:MAG TPA: pyridoxamine 5'-phosphate oxidase family protein [Planctomycetota bacterium]|nr:pyridoxamine 5'-phosphate oxidase family protein [Planctomycetota bacterium]